MCESVLVKGFTASTAVEHEHYRKSSGSEGDSSKCSVSLYVGISVT